MLEGMSVSSLILWHFHPFAPHSPGQLTLLIKFFSLLFATNTLFSNQHPAQLRVLQFQTSMIVTCPQQFWRRIYDTPSYIVPSVLGLIISSTTDFDQNLLLFWFQYLTTAPSHYLASNKISHSVLSIRSLQHWKQKRLFHQSAFSAPDHLLFGAENDMFSPICHVLQHFTLRFAIWTFFGK